LLHLQNELFNIFVLKCPLQEAYFSRNGQILEHPYFPVFPEGTAYILTTF